MFSHQFVNTKCNDSHIENVLESWGILELIYIYIYVHCGHQTLGNYSESQKQTN